MLFKKNPLLQVQHLSGPFPKQEPQLGSHGIHQESLLRDSLKVVEGQV